MMPGLSLPTLEAGWKYEGWVVVDGLKAAFHRNLYLPQRNG
ncbi:MAG: hypothetical protein R3B47_16030 [Bacteroidia bacterium]